MDPMRIVQAMQARGYRVDVGNDVMNIVYIEGMELSGAPNGNRPNCWDDVRMLIRVAPGGQASILGAWEATTEPGQYWTDHPMNAAGAFHIDLGQQTAWVPGMYHNAEALVQARSLKGTRDGARHYARDGMHVEGMYGVHHHKGYDFAKDNIGKSSAGCQVGRTVAGHMEFMNILHTDRRWSPSFMWTSTVMPASWITASAPPVFVTIDTIDPSGRPLVSSIKHMFGM